MPIAHTLTIVLDKKDANNFDKALGAIPSAATHCLSDDKAFDASSDDRKELQNAADELARSGYARRNRI